MKARIWSYLTYVTLGIAIIALIRGCSGADKKFLEDIKRRALCEKQCYPMRAVWDREVDSCDCEVRK